MALSRHFVGCCFRSSIVRIYSGAARDQVLHTIWVLIMHIRGVGGFINVLFVFVSTGVASGYKVRSGCKAVKVHWIRSEQAAQSESYEPTCNLNTTCLSFEK